MEFAQGHVAIWWQNQGPSVGFPSPPLEHVRVSVQGAIWSLFLSVILSKQVKRHCKLTPGVFKLTCGPSGFIPKYYICAAI